MAHRRPLRPVPTRDYPLHPANLAAIDNKPRSILSETETRQPVKEVAEMLAYFQEHTYLCADSRGAIALANRVAGRQPTKFAAWARAKFALLAAA